jgi:hypothetical protein
MKERVDDGVTNRRARTQCLGERLRFGCLSTTSGESPEHCYRIGIPWRDRIGLPREWKPESHQ